MLDLHSEDVVINHYADRYRNLMPVNSRKSIKIMDTAEAHAFEIWDKSLPLVVSETNSLDKAVGALVGLAVGDAVGAALECKRRDSEHSLNLGTLASKAFSTTDEELAKHLSNANYILRVRYLVFLKIFRNFMDIFRFSGRKRGSICFLKNRVNRSVLHPFRAAIPFVTRCGRLSQTSHITCFHSFPFVVRSLALTS